MKHATTSTTLTEHEGDGRTSSAQRGNDFGPEKAVRSADGTADVGASYTPGRANPRGSLILAVVGLVVVLGLALFFLLSLH
jgi:hypothetical protein